MKTTVERLRDVNTGQAILDGYAIKLADTIEAVDKELKEGKWNEENDWVLHQLRGLRKGVCIASDLFLQRIGVPE